MQAETMLHPQQRAGAMDHHLRLFGENNYLVAAFDFSEKNHENMWEIVTALRAACSDVYKTLARRRARPHLLPLHDPGLGSPYREHDPGGAAPLVGDGGDDSDNWGDSAPKPCITHSDDGFADPSAR
jgi:hypothetical protein